MSLADALSEHARELAEFTAGEQITASARAQAPSGWEPGLQMDGPTGTITTQPVTAAPDWDDLLRVWDLDPAEFEVVEPVQFRAWDAAIGGGEVRRMFYYRATIRRRRNGQPAIDELLAAIGKRRPKVSPQRDSKDAFVAITADTQIGDGETSEVISRFEDKTQQALDNLKAARKRGLVGDQAVLPWLGDCVQGVVSQGGALVWRNDLTLVEALRVYRRLALWQVSQFAALAEVRVVAIPGNHDDPTRVGGIKSSPAHDSWATDGISAVEDTLRFAGGFDHVTFTYPEPDQSTVTLDIQGTNVGMAHGHQWKGAASGIHAWWAKQSHGRTGIGAADVLLTGHRHHYYAEVAGGNRFALVAPPLVSTGSYWTDATGDRTPPGIVTMRIGGGSWSGVEIL